ncbi:hypothetical protein M513_01403 [Trichuris suis]|uniref:Eukaryotic initiation factor 4E n=2 Tax=Trichuris suis TaxID=68888 RepID=A0A085MKI7_9BILA|nr:hypothetical protein M513_01403 [Trichuris suis]
MKGGACVILKYRGSSITRDPPRDYSMIFWEIDLCNLTSRDGSPRVCCTVCKMTSEEEPLHWSLFSSDDDDDYANDNGEEESLDRSGDTNTSSVDVLTVSSPSSHSESPTWNSFSEEDDPHFVPLLHTWIWWYHKPNRQSRGPWSENLHRVTMIDDAVTFWHFYHNLKRPSELPVGADYFIFKADLTPKWETPENARGGRVAVSFNRSNVSSQQGVNMSWLKFIIAVLSGQLEFLCSYINGIFVSVRSKGYKVGLWLHSDSNDDDKKQFREVFKILVGKEHPAFYKPHIKVLR